jgi:myo-inositol-1(or 4)-monophosphatase
MTRSTTDTLKIMESVSVLLSEAHVLVKTLGEDADEIVSAGTSFGDLENDTDIAADKALGQFFFDRILEQDDNLGGITIEGLCDESWNLGNHWWCVDPLDGSLNFALRGNTLGLPYSACVTVLETASSATFGNVIAAGVIDLRSGDLWLTRRIAPDRYVTTINDRPARTMQVSGLDLGSQIVIGEFYYPGNRERLARAFAGQKGWLRNPGSAAYEMALVSSGQACAFICETQKQHELGAAYALVRGAGGVVVDFNGNDLGSTPYVFNTQTPAILAANACIAEEILTRMAV